jgi:hypothetical protein
MSANRLWRGIICRKRYKTLSFKTEVHDYFFSEWLKVRDEFAYKNAIRSFFA